MIDSVSGGGFALLFFLYGLTLIHTVIVYLDHNPHQSAKSTIHIYSLYFKSVLICDHL